MSTPAGELCARVEIPSGFIPVTDIVPAVRRLGEQAVGLEEARAKEKGRSISCRMGCAACCRMLVPVSPPEAFALQETVQALPEPKRRAFEERVRAATTRLKQADLLSRLDQIGDTDRQLSDKDLEQVNREYYALRLPCSFLEDEVCSIYEDRPSACRELLVTSPAELCQDIAGNPVHFVPVPVRMSTVLSMLWAELVGGPARLIPLPVALGWAERHEAERRRAWKATHLFERAMDMTWKYLSKEFAARRGRPAAPPRVEKSPE